MLKELLKNPIKTIKEGIKADRECLKLEYEIEKAKIVHHSITESINRYYITRRIEN